MWIEMSQYIPNTAISRLTAMNALGNDAQPASPVLRSATAASLPTHSILPLRWAVMIQSRIAVATIAPSVAPMTWPIAAPPAGGWPAARTDVVIEVIRAPSRRGELTDQTDRAFRS